MKNSGLLLVYNRLDTEGGDTMGYKIRVMRKKKLMTQEDLAKKSGVSRATISALESDRGVSTSTKTLTKIALALDTTVDEIFFTKSV